MIGNNSYYKGWSSLQPFVASPESYAIKDELFIGHVISISYEENGKIVVRVANKEKKILDKDVKAEAYPANINMIKYPLPGETVLMFEGISSDVKSGKFTNRFYYYSVISTDQSIMFNSNPSIGLTVPVEYAPTVLTDEYQKRYESKIKSLKSYVKDSPSAVSFRSELKDEATIKPAEGDVNIQGRFGSSIRLGSSVLNTTGEMSEWSKKGSVAGNPIVILSTDRNRGTVQYENINKTESGIYLATNQILPIDIASSTRLLTFDKKYDTVPVTFDNDDLTRAIPSDEIETYEQLYLYNGNFVTYNGSPNSNYGGGGGGGGGNTTVTPVTPFNGNIGGGASGDPDGVLDLTPDTFPWDGSYKRYGQEALRPHEAGLNDPTDIICYLFTMTCEGFDDAKGGVSWDISNYRIGAGMSSFTLPNGSEFNVYTGDPPRIDGKEDPQLLEKRMQRWPYFIDRQTGVAKRPTINEIDMVKLICGEGNGPRSNKAGQTGDGVWYVNSGGGAGWIWKPDYTAQKSKHPFIMAAIEENKKAGPLITLHGANRDLAKKVKDKRNQLIEQLQTGSGCTKERATELINKMSPQVKAMLIDISHAYGNWHKDPTVGYGRAANEKQYKKASNTTKVGYGPASLKDFYDRVGYSNRSMRLSKAIDLCDGDSTTIANLIRYDLLGGSKQRDLGRYKIIMGIYNLVLQ